MMDNYSHLTFILLIILSGISISLLQNPSQTEKFKVQDFNHTYSKTDNSSLEFKAELVNETVTEESPAVIRMSLSGWDGKFMTQSGPYAPFSVPEAVKQDSNYSINLWNDDYRDKSSIRPGSALAIPDSARIGYWENESITREYELITRERVVNISAWRDEPASEEEEELILKEGEYVVEDSIGYSFDHDHNSDYEWLSYRIEFRVISD